jgi:hypothetical protein
VVGRAARGAVRHGVCHGTVRHRPFRNNYRSNTVRFTTALSLRHLAFRCQAQQRLLWGNQTWKRNSGESLDRVEKKWTQAAQYHKITGGVEIKSGTVTVSVRVMHGFA